ncbi:pyridoxal-phosphate dependent enzyme [Monashia sp. NPDC004114]
MIHASDLASTCRRLEPAITLTRVLRLKRQGTEFFLKAEHEQVCGSFKSRGAWNAVLCLDARAMRRGVVAASSGNHGYALATAAAAAGTTAVVVLPDDCPMGKRTAIAQAGARIVEYDPQTDDRDEVVARVARQEARTIVRSADDLQVVCGAATVASELLEQAGGLDAIVVPVGGGGLAAGTAIAANLLCPGCRVVGVEPRTGDDTRQSMIRGSRVRIPVPATIADGLRHRTPGELTFPIVRRLVDRIIVVEDAEILAAMRLLHDRFGVHAEPSGAVALAGALSERLGEPSNSRIGVVVSGGSITDDEWDRLLGAPQ